MPGKGIDGENSSNNNNGPSANKGHATVNESNNTTAAAAAGDKSPSAAITPTTGNVPPLPPEQQSAAFRRAMSPSMPHHNIRADDTTEVENMIKQDSVKSNKKRYYSTSSDRTVPSAYERFIAYLRVKSRLLGYSIYFIIFLLTVALLVACSFVTYWLINSYFFGPPIPIKTSGCMPMRVTLCQKFNVQYAYTTLPNKFGLTNQAAINEKLTSSYLIILGIKCYTLLPLFLCAQYAPKCNSTGHAVPMCRNICKEAKHRCNFFLDIFDISWPDDIDCDTLPDSPDPDICVGNQQTQEMNQLTNRHTCKENGFRCDSTRCIPSNWKCDGYIDCNDSMDEKDCSNCRKDQFHCGHGVCINRDNICDGRRDCPDGRDERQCFNLSESMGMNGRGKLQVWNVTEHKWNLVCGENWAVPEQSEQVCRMLGYRRTNETRLQDETYNYAKLRKAQSNRALVPLHKHINFYNRQPSSNNQCRNTVTSVHIKCEQFECGRPAQTFPRKRRNMRIVGGDESYPGKWPWLVAFHGGPAEVFFCAGVLISEWWVLTAAHCIGRKTDVSGWVLNLGVTRRTSSPLFMRQRRVAKLIKHPGFQMSLDYYYSDDIALVLLEEKVEFDEFLRPVCLPANSSVTLEPDTKCMVIGWGKKIHDDYADYQSAIHEVEVPIVSHHKCIQWYSKQLPYHPIPDTMMCAGYEQGKKDACQGDSGGPLLCYNPDQSWFVAGIVSWGINCAQPQLPGIYTNVPKYLEWIKLATFEHQRPISVNANLDYQIP